MRSSELQIDIKGLKEAVAEIKRLGGKFDGSAHNRNAVSAAGGVIRRAVEAKAPVESGTLKKNIRVRVAKAKKTRNYYAVIGARRKVRQRNSPLTKQAVRFSGGRAKAITSKQAQKLHPSQVRYRSPSRYLHLVERGSQIHGIRVASRRAMVTWGGEFIGAAALHRGFAGSRFMRAAAKSSTRAAFDAAKAKLQRALKQETKHG